MDLKVGRVLAREFAGYLASKVPNGSLEQTIRSARPNEEHKALGPATSELLREFLATHGLNPESALVDWEGNAQRRGLQQQSYSLLGTWTHPDLAVVAPFCPTTITSPH